MNLYLGADYRGVECKKILLDFLAQHPGITGVVEDLGAYDSSEENDFNDPAIAVSKLVREDPVGRGILICDSAHGMTIQANRYKGIRAVHCDSTESARLAREHDDANILCLSAHFMDEGKLREITKTFIETDFQPLERRVRRINRLDERQDYA